MPDYKNKIKSLTELKRIVSLYKRQGKKIVLCHGVFDLIHLGHIRHFATAKKHGDILVVSVVADQFARKGPGMPIFKQELRAEVLSSIQFIDYLTIVSSPFIVDILHAARPHVFVTGSDGAFGQQELSQAEALMKKLQGKVVYTHELSFSSSALIHKHFDIYPSEIKQFLSGFSQRYNSASVLGALSRLKSLRVLVIGDAIIDQYYYSDPMGKSSKEPIVVHRYLSEESFAGGALATANHLASLSDSVTLVTVLGKKNSFESFVRKKLNGAIRMKLFFQSNASTIIKRRFIDQETNQKLFQISYIGKDVISKNTEGSIARFLLKEIPSYDLVMVNDFGHGLVTDRLIKIIVARAKYLAINVQANSANYGFNVVTKYPHANYVCIDEMELRLATHDKYSDIRTLAKKVYSLLTPEIIVVTRGRYGALSYTKKQGFMSVPALTDKIVDRVGAGDALLSVTAPLAYIKVEQELLTFIGNAAAALKVQIIGNKNPIDRQELAAFITRLLQ